MLVHRHVLVALAATMPLPIWGASVASQTSALVTTDSLPAATSYDAIFEQLTALEPLSRGAPVSDLILSRDVARFVLEQGVVYSLSPVAGRTIGVVFVGRGRFQFAVSDPAERANAKRLLELESDSIDVSFDRLLLLFADGTMEELETALTFSERVPEGDAAKHVEYALKYLSDPDDRYFDPGLLTAVMNGTRADYFFANLRDGGDDPLMVEISPWETEGVKLMRKSKLRGAGETGEIVCQFPLASDRETSTAQDSRDLVHITRQVIDLAIDDDMKVSASVELTIEPKFAGYSWVPFLLFPGFEVESATWGDGAPATFFWKKENPYLWIRFDPPTDEAGERLVRLSYSGDDLIERGEGWYYLQTSTGWYPHHGSRALSVFDITYHRPETVQLASVGVLQAADTSDDVITSRWVTQRPIRNAGFNIGEFENLEIDYPGVPRTTVYIAREAHSNLGMTVRDRMGREIRLQTRYLSGDRMDKAVASDVVSSLSFFTKTFGEPLDNRFWATEIPYSHGEAFPGIVHLSWFTFDQEHDDGVDQVFRAHEMAHQWWGIGVDYETYRDRWLSEGLAEFAALFYLDLVLMNREQYVKTLKEWREEIMDDADKAGPIALGHRVATSEHPEFYNLMVYEKGAWVAHMLRGMMVDLQTGSDDKFIAMMQDFYKRYRGKRASTEDFRSVVEQHIGMDMQWFFDEWINGTAIPSYEFSYQVTETPDGQFGAKLRVEQENVPDDFKMIVPVMFEFPDDQWAEIQLTVEGPLTELEIPQLPLEPKQIRLNPGEAVLAEVHDVRWKVN
jgi:hypothetical protein